MLGDVLPGVDPAKLKELEYVAIAAHERGPVPHAKVALPAAAWAEVAGTITNSKGHVQRMHAAFPPPGQALPAWEASSGSRTATGVKLRVDARARGVQGHDRGGAGVEGADLGA